MKAKSYTLRMPKALRDWYEQESQIQERSLNQVLVRALQEKMDREEITEEDAKEKPQCSNTGARTNYTV
ncbi:hypothetical protein [Grimontia sp. NTOU-MAR1]|uniref:hypothetical protein n=1 Tax=Grimontia sp. NTOU-MAR1 TaxID=3111011 RepID=UPI002DB83EFB|nr:hypothetical protein [Grimontia sp. NTOU-MAR1]WRV98876.1 hypothetical protein VP504_05485 [Grimontia sp. NTOU-MAR1]